MERIRCSAIRKEGKIYIGRYHGEIFKQEEKEVLRDGEQGFITEEGRFVDRVEGLKIAEKAGQIIKKHNFLCWLQNVQNALRIKNIEIRQMI